MRMGQGVRTGLGHGGITCVLQTQFSSFVSPSADSRGAVVSYWRKYVHEVLVYRLGALSLPRKSVVRLTDRPYMTLDVYGGCKTTTHYNHLHRTYVLVGE